MPEIILSAKEYEQYKALLKFKDDMKENAIVYKQSSFDRRTGFDFFIYSKSEIMNEISQLIEKHRAEINKLKGKIREQSEEYHSHTIEARRLYNSVLRKQKEATEENDELKLQIENLKSKRFFTKWLK